MSSSLHHQTNTCHSSQTTTELRECCGKTQERRGKTLQAFRIKTRTAAFHEHREARIRSAVDFPDVNRELN
ncbi:hypothetical protein E2C01_091806 [Portunus trituberculatus]|uniref:Uncharacterized protein n=1 Tax=Portunus trituberculatus TaxID=210409 RepID=A0A5B7JQ28_PORTR|nr:hypothetical protein [Portunus trituberculatus]